MSLQAGLEAAVAKLALMPAYGQREVIVIHGALSSVDAGDINKTIEALVTYRVRVSAISLPGEVYLLTRLVRETGGGSYTVPDSKEALRAALLGQCPPQVLKKLPSPSSSSSSSSAQPPPQESSALIPMGFPRRVVASPGLCACHGAIRSEAYACPRCGARACNVPADCPACSLRLVSAADLARSYHHLLPLPPFVEVVPGGPGGVIDLPASVLGGEGEEGVVSVTVHDASTHCAGCRGGLGEEALRYVCGGCWSAFCGGCDAVIHDTLHNCPGCV